MEDIVVSDVDLDTEQGLVFIFNLPDVPERPAREREVYRSRTVLFATTSVPAR